MIRKELTTEIRFEIAYLAYQAQYNKIYGEITNLANRYKICRAFVYVLLNRLKEYISTIFSPKEQEKKIGKKEIIARVLMLRMVGGSSIQAISSLLKYDELEYSSVGSISQNLSAIGKMLPTVQTIPMDERKEITAVADEIFIGNQPILITAEPKSSAILSIELAKDRTKERWSEHIAKIELSGKIEIIYMVTDEGTGLRSAISDKDILWQPDTYHAIAHRLGKWVHILEARAYKKIAIEYERKRVSSIIENINSILRPYLDHSKNQITQEFLNLFAFYHNHRRYNDGKRKGKIPMEILTNKKQDKDWVELLTDFIEDTKPSFFL